MGDGKAEMLRVGRDVAMQRLYRFDPGRYGLSRRRPGPCRLRLQPARRHRLYPHRHIQGGDEGARLERIIAALVRYNGVRQAEGYGLECVDYQAKMAAIAYNLKRWAAMQRVEERAQKVKRSA